MDRSHFGRELGRRVLLSIFIQEYAPPLWLIQEDICRFSTGASPKF
jgi:hypothetical protein